MISISGVSLFTTKDTKVMRFFFVLFVSFVVSFWFLAD